MISGFLCGHAIFLLFVNDQLNNMGFFNTKSSLIMHFYKHENSAVITIPSTDQTLFFDGRKMYIYNMQTSRLCEEPYETAYVVDVGFNKTMGFLCSEKLSNIMDFYINVVKAHKQTMIITHPPLYLDAWGILQMLNKKGLLDLKAFQRNPPLTADELTNEQ
jgi:hypothetical protein